MVTKFEAWEHVLFEMNTHSGDAKSALEKSSYGYVFTKAWEAALHEAMKMAEGNPELIEALKEKL